MDSNTIRVMTFAGGSTKGYGENLFVKKIIQQLGLTALQFFSNVDAMGGVSIGSILACGYAYGKTPEQLETFFLQDAQYIFSTTSSTPSNKVSTSYKAAWMGNPLPFDLASWYDSGSDNTWGSGKLHQVLLNNFGTDTMSMLNKPVVISAVQHDTGKAVLFSNYYDPPYFIGNTEKIVDVCRASSAAMPYLPEYTFGGHDYIDGAFVINNVAKAAINIGISLKPNAKRIIVIDVGAGLKGNGFMSNQTNITPPSESGYKVIIEHLNRALANAEDYDRWMLEYSFNRHNDLNGRELHYYKFQPNYPLTFSAEADESNPVWFAELQSRVESHYSDESTNISSILAKWMS